MDTRTAESRLPLTLGAWAVKSLAIGGLAWGVGRRSGRPQLAGFGRQMAMWGAIDGVIAGFGLLGSAGKMPDSDGSRRRKLRRILAINSAADVAYIAGGTALALAARDTGTRTVGPVTLTAGDGVAIALQGAVLLGIDAYYAARLA